MRRNFSSKFKSKVAIEAVKEKNTMRELAQKFEIQACQVQKWKKNLLENVSYLFTDKRSSEEKDQESLVQELYQQIGRLKVENDFLKKKL